MTPLTRSQTREATALLVAAFDEDPYFNCLTPEKAEREVFVGAVMGTNLVLGYPGYTGGTGGTAYTEVKVQAVANAFSSPESIGVTYGSGMVGTVRGRSIVTNPTWDTLRVLKYTQELPPGTLVNFAYDNSAIWGKRNPTWKLVKEGDSSFGDRYSTNRYFSFLFTERGSYTLSLTVEDTNGNTKEVTKRELIRIA